MLCSDCKKNPAIIFFQKQENNKEKLEGLCYNCAKKRGINPLETLKNQSDLLGQDKVNLNDMSKQFEAIFKDLAENINLEDLENIEGAITFGNPANTQDENFDEDDAFSDEKPKIAGAAIPLGSIFSNMFGANSSNNINSTNSQENEELDRKRIKVDKKKMPKQNKKKKYLDTFGTNLTNKAKNNELDIVIGRDKEIQRIIQILNRRSKNNPCLIGEPGVGKTAIAQGLLQIKMYLQNYLIKKYICWI